MRTETYDDNGVLRQRLDDKAGRVTEWDAEQNIIEDRDYTPAEVAAADARTRAEAGTHVTALRRTIATIRARADSLVAALDAATDGARTASPKTSGI